MGLIMEVAPLTARDIEGAIYRMTERHARHFRLRGDECPWTQRVRPSCLRVVRIPFGLRREMVVSNQYLQIAEYEHGAVCPMCYRETQRRLTEEIAALTLPRDMDKRFAGHRSDRIAEINREALSAMKLLPVLPMYRKHVLDSKGGIVAVVHMSQCQDCHTVIWSPVTVKPGSGKRPNLRLVELSAPRKRKKQATDPSWRPREKTIRVATGQVCELFGDRTWTPM